MFPFSRGKKRKVTFTLYQLWSPVVLAFFLFIPNAQAQFSNGRISGVVYDPSNAAIPGATISIRDERTGLERETTTNEEGAYVVLYDGEILDVNTLAPLLNRVVMEKDEHGHSVKSPVAIVAHGYSDQVLKMMAQNFRQGILTVLQAALALLLHPGSGHVAEGLGGARDALVDGVVEALRRRRADLGDSCNRHADPPCGLVAAGDRALRRA